MSCFPQGLQRLDKVEDERDLDPAPTCLGAYPSRQLLVDEKRGQL